VPDETSCPELGSEFDPQLVAPANPDVEFGQVNISEASHRMNLSLFVIWRSYAPRWLSVRILQLRSRINVSFTPGPVAKKLSPDGTNRCVAGFRSRGPVGGGVPVRACAGA
jgi:hypothetical protein